MEADMATQHPLLAFFGHHKCATKFIVAILKQVCRDCGLNLLTISSAKQVDGDVRTLLDSSRADVLAYMNAQWRHAKLLANFRGFHIIRDPRDVLVSAYFSHLHSHETRDWDALSTHRKSLQKLSKAEGLLLEMDFCAPVFQAMRQWQYGHADILELRFEQLVADPYQWFLRVFEHLGLIDDDRGAASRLLFGVQSAVNRRYRFGAGPIPFRWPARWIPAGRMLAHVYANRFSKRTGGRDRGDENVQHHFRKGVPGDWKNHFSDEHVCQFSRRYGDLLEITGYAPAAAAPAAVTQVTARTATAAA
jgi:hypothetical protein